MSEQLGAQLGLVIFVFNFEIEELHTSGDDLAPEVIQIELLDCLKQWLQKGRFVLSVVHKRLKFIEAVVMQHECFIRLLWLVDKEQSQAFVR
jgi:hypothetical protein